ncbi:MAG: GNAT family N-acetyltransferase [Gemmataceae bacterium]
MPVATAPPEACRAAPPGPPPGVVVCATAADLEAHRPAWEDLARHACEPNPFYEPWFFLPGLRRFDGERHHRFLMIYGEPPKVHPPRPVPAPLIGFVPMTCRRLSRFAPLCVLDMWSHLYNFLCTPLLRAGSEAEALDRLFDWFRDAPGGQSLWRLELVSGDGPFARAMTDLTFRRQRPRFLVSGYARALIEPLAPSGAAYLDNAMHNRRVKEIRRKERQLSQRGKLERRALGPADDPSPWIDDFLAVEGSGWKGRDGTAFASDPGHAAFFREMALGAHAAGRLDMLGLYLDGRPIAVKCNLQGGTVGSFAFKIAFDEAFASQSPGVLLEAFNIDRLHQQRGIRWMDSCAMPNHFMISRMWSERRLIQNLWVSTGRAPGDLAVSLMPLAQWLKRKLRFFKPRPRAEAPPEE